MAGFWDSLFPGGEGALADLFWGSSSWGSSSSSTPTVISSKPTVISTRPIQRSGRYIYEGTDGEDNVDTYDLFRTHTTYEGFDLYGNNGDDTLAANILNDSRHDNLFGGEGNDWLVASSYMSPSASVVVNGGLGRDKFYAPGYKITNDPSFQRWGGYTSFSLFDPDDGSQLDVFVADDVEVISIKSDTGVSFNYLTEDLARGITRKVDWGEQYNRTYENNADWFTKDLDTFTPYHGQTIYSAFKAPEITDAIVDFERLLQTYDVFDVGGENEEVLYYVHPGGNEIELGYDENGETLTRLTEDTSALLPFIQETFEALDKILDVDFVLSETAEDTLIDIYAVANTGIQYNGSTYWPEGLWTEIEFTISGDIQFDKHVILQQLGHALGLDFPYGDAFDPRYTVEDTVMSGNISSDGWTTKFTDADRSVLLSIWGEEDDLIPPSSPPSSPPSQISSMSMDLTGDGVIDATDSLLMMRHMMGTFPGDAITQGIPNIADVEGLRQKIMSNMEQVNTLGGGYRMDIDGDGIINPLSDGLAITHYIHAKGSQGGIPQIPDVFENPMRGFDEMQNHLKDLVGF